MGVETWNGGRGGARSRQKLASVWGEEARKAAESLEPAAAAAPPTPLHPGTPGRAREEAEQQQGPVEGFLSAWSCAKFFKSIISLPPGRWV